jgi:hypothetical protein
MPRRFGVRGYCSGRQGLVVSVATEVATAARCSDGAAPAVRHNARAAVWWTGYAKLLASSDAVTWFPCVTYDRVTAKRSVRVVAGISGNLPAVLGG